jgi:hypothetical protein
MTASSKKNSTFVARGHLICSGATVVSVSGDWRWTPQYPTKIEWPFTSCGKNPCPFRHPGLDPGFFRKMALLVAKRCRIGVRTRRLSVQAGIFAAKPGV